MEAEGILKDCGFSEEEQKRFMQTFEKIYKNLNAK